MGKSTSLLCSNILNTFSALFVEVQNNPPAVLLSLSLFSVTVCLMAAFLRRGIFVALHHAVGQGSRSVCPPALPAALLGRVTRQL